MAIDVMYSLINTKFTSFRIC